MDDVRRPAPATSGRGFNSGVMVMHVAAMRARMPAIESVLERDGRLHPHQRGLRPGRAHSAIPEGDWDRLPDILNWRPAFGINPQASIVHWHGPKPRHVEKTLASGVTSAPDDAMPALFEAAPDAYRHYLDVFRTALLDA